jgi:hypothetical protein
VRKGFALVLAGLTSLVFAPSASASYHLMSIREVATNPAGADSAYIELQMYEPGQNFVGGHTVSFYTANGTLATKLDIPIGMNVPNGDNQRTVLIGDTAAPVTPDITYPVLGDTVLTYGPTGGAACWDTIDCVSWGNFNNTSGNPLPSPTGTPAAPSPPGIQPGQAIVRSIAPGCATLLEAGDDTNNSSTDFALATPSPRNNSMTPTETPCNGDVGCGGGGRGGGTTDTDPPDTTITKAPKSPTTKTTAKFKFISDEANSTFRCSIDKKPYKPCKSPKKYKHLKPGKHKLKVAAIDPADNVDPTPAKAKVKVLEKG